MRDFVVNKETKNGIVKNAVNDVTIRIQNLIGFLKSQQRSLFTTIIHSFQIAIHKLQK